MVQHPLGGFYLQQVHALGECRSLGLQPKCAAYWFYRPVVVQLSLQVIKLYFNRPAQSPQFYLQ